MRLDIENLAHIRHASVELGDLTVLVGPQAAGKSLVLQTLKLALDGRYIARRMRDYGLVVNETQDFLARYFGEGMERIWRETTRVRWRGRRVHPRRILAKARKGEERVHYVPAHRTLVLSGGHPPTFQQFRPETPYVVRQFSENVRSVLLDSGRDTLFPQAKRLKGRVREKIAEAIFRGAALREVAEGAERRLKLHYPRAIRLSYMAWTAGQREFVPLLVGLYPLLPAGAMTRRREIDWVILEEAEMGLHPNGIMALMLLVLDLMSRGYRVAMSTHSPLVLDVVWAIRHLERDSWKELLEIFGISGVTRANAGGEVRMAEAALRKRYRVFALDFRGRYVVSRDISELDPASSDRTMAGWGGLTSHSSVIGDVVARHAAG
ncbi:MAG: ATP-binding protein [Burkholderiales bacterium]|nr:ATP-binding protein [Burkholderiales bacterium]